MSFASPWRKAAARAMSLISADARVGVLLRILLGFLLFNLVVRLGLLAFNGAWELMLPTKLVPIVAIGALFDLTTFGIAFLPLSLLVLLGPDGPRTRRWVRGVVGALLACMVAVMVLVGASEFVFWNEFSSRFNFIAVDYLIYTHEVIGNIRESYNMPALVAVVAAVSAVGWLVWMRAIKPQWLKPTTWRARWQAVLVVLAWPVLAWFAVHAPYKEFSSDAQANELAGNGWYDFWHAFRHNEIDYERFYATLPGDGAVRALASEMLLRGRPVEVQSQRPYDRWVSHPGQATLPLNVVMVSIESFSAEFMTAFGGKDARGQSLTPALDRLAQEGMLFTQLYATGTRTVRGLEALTLSIPPTPGHAVVKRPGNDNLFTIGEVFRTQGYEPMYVYGGYGYFDNMNAFFGGNGYTVIDRTALAAADIHFENIWGVADEDLFTLTLRELDRRHAAGTKFFAHVMTTSNHRPFTYPEGRIDIPSKTGRDGGVKYTDWAIGDFIQRAKSKPWFDNTLFVLVADHTHKGRGRQELPPANYHIPMVVYAPKHIQPQRIDTLASQIDVAPTILGLLNINYRSRFFGHDILREGKDHPRALLANYQTVGYYEQGRVVELKPNRRVRVVHAADGTPAPDDDVTKTLINGAIGYYQTAASAYRKGELKLASPSR